MTAAMSRKLLLTLLISIVAHVAVVRALESKEVAPPMTHTGSLKAPVALTFSAVSQPKVATPPKQSVPKPKPVVKKQPKPVIPTPIAKAKPVLKKPEPKPEPAIEKKPEPVKPKPKQKPEDTKDPAPDPSEKPVVEEPPVEKTAVQKSKAEGLNQKPVRVTNVNILHQEKPRYPRMAKRRNQQGIVILDIVVDEEGLPEAIKILTSSGYPSLDKAAVASVKHWRFKPERRHNQRVKSQVHVPVNFQIN